MDKPQRRFGFPLLMLIGFAVGACIAVVTAFVLSGGVAGFKYTRLFDLVVPLGALGTYLGHVVGAVKYKDAGFAPFGPLTPGVFAIGAAIVLGGSILVLFGVGGVLKLMGH